MERGMIISAQGNSVMNALAKAREVAGLKLKDSREVLRSGGEDGCYRVHLADGNIVEVAVIKHSSSSAVIVE
jgi:hypothetical protein